MKVLQLHGHGMAALGAGEILALNAAQQTFLEAAEGKRVLVCLHEKAWIKGLGCAKL